MRIDDRNCDRGHPMRFVCKGIARADFKRCKRPPWKKFDAVVQEIREGASGK